MFLFAGANEVTTGQISCATAPMLQASKDNTKWNRLPLLIELLRILRYCCILVYSSSKDEGTAHLIILWNMINYPSRAPAPGGWLRPALIPSQLMISSKGKEQRIKFIFRKVQKLKQM